MHSQIEWVRTLILWQSCPDDTKFELQYQYIWWLSNEIPVGQLWYAWRWQLSINVEIVNVLDKCIVYYKVVARSIDLSCGKICYSLEMSIHWYKDIEILNSKQIGQH